MGILNKLFSGSSEPKEEKVMPWLPLTSITQLEDIAALSKTKTQIIFKHSTRCGISRMVMSQFEAAYNIDINTDLYYLDLLNHRDISSEIASKFDVFHQSPQLLIFKNGVVVAHESHGAINDMDMAKYA